MVDEDENEDNPAEGEESTERAERPRGLLPRFVVVLTSLVLIVVLALSPMNQSISPRPSLYKTLPFERVDYALLASTTSQSRDLVEEFILIAPERVNPEDLEKLAQELKWEGPQAGRLAIALFSDARAAALYGRFFGGRATSEEGATFQAGFVGTLTRNRPGGPLTLDVSLGGGKTLRRQF